MSSSIFGADGVIHAARPESTATEAEEGQTHKPYGRHNCEDISVCLNCKKPYCPGICMDVRAGAEKAKRKRDSRKRSKKQGNEVSGKKEQAERDIPRP